MQAVISLSGQMDPITGSSKAHIGRSEVLDVGSYFGVTTAGTFAIQLPDNSTVELETYKFLADLGMLSSFNSGLYNSYSTGQTTSLVCPTANCTWPTYTSLAICSACNDVTSHLQRSTQYGTNLGTLSSNTFVFSGDFTTYSLPHVNLTNFNTNDGTSLNSAYMTATIITKPQLTISFNNLTTLVTATQVLKAAEGYETGELTWDDTPVSATECALYFCANAYQSVVKKGILTEHIVASWAKRDFSSYRDIKADDDFDLYEKWNNYSLYAGMGDFSRSDLELFIPEEDVKKHALPDDAALRFKLTHRTVGSTTHYVNEQFLGPGMRWPIGDLPYGAQTPAVQALYQSENLSASFDKIAWSVSNWMRDISNVTQDGTGEEWVIHIHVEWPYMVLPLLTIVLGLLFSVSSIVETRRLHLDPWKTDMVATLTYSVDAETRAQLRHADRNGYLEKSIKAMTAKFEDVGCGLELRTQQT